MWISDLEEALSTMPKEWKIYVCYQNIKQGYHSIIFETTSDTILLFDTDLLTWVKYKKGEGVDKFQSI